MTERGRQLVFDLPHRAALGRDDFLVTASNHAAVAMIDQWPNWPVASAVLVGPAGSGKSHLVEVWRQRSGASRVDAVALSETAVPDLVRSGAVAVEDLSPGAIPERALFHLLNYAKQERVSVLMTSAEPPGAWAVALPDLATRLNALPVALLGNPDDALLRGVLVKLFADRQLAVEEGLLNYLLPRMPRSLDAARSLVDLIDRTALAEKSALTKTFVSRLLKSVNAPGLFPDED